MQDRIFEYRRAAIEDIEELVRTRILVLRAAKSGTAENMEVTV